METLNIGRDYSKNPSGRYVTDGPNSGQRFRDDFLLPKLSRLKGGETLTVILDDGVIAYGSSFLSEGFGGIVREGFYTANDLLSKLEFSYSNSDFDFFKDRIVKYIHDMDKN